MAHFRLAIIGDIHSNFLALRSCLQSISNYEATSSTIDIIVFVGDLLTYGVLPCETLSAVHQVISCRNAVIVLGNHDQLYINLIRNSQDSYYARLPGWIKESVNYNLDCIDPKMFLSLDFLPFYGNNGIFISHANLSQLVRATLSWAYVNTFDDHLEQLKILSRSNYDLGVFGHTHRPRCYSFLNGDSSTILQDFPQCVFRNVLPDSPLDLSSFPCTVINAGSIGQPRDASLLSPTWLLVEVNDSTPNKAKFISFDYDIGAHLNDIRKSRLSARCIQKLVSFF